MILSHDYPRPLHNGQVSFKSYLRSKIIYLSQASRWDFFQALRTIFSTTIVASDWCVMQTHGWSMVGSLLEDKTGRSGTNWLLCCLILGIYVQFHCQ